MKNMRIVFASIATLALLVPALAFGATMKTGTSVFFEKGTEIRDNIYAAGSNVSVGSPVSGDILAAGGSILVSETVSGDVAAVGGTITILKEVQGDVRVVGGNMLIGGNVTGDVIVVGGSVVIPSDVTIGKDLVVVGGQVSLDGTVAGNARIIGGTAVINGHIAGNIYARIDDTITVNKNAVIGGTLEYSARKAEALKVQEGASLAGEPVFKKREIPQPIKPQKFFAAAAGMFIFIKLASFIVAALVAIKLFKRFSDSVVEGSVRDPLRALGYGFVALITIPVASILLLITVIGVPLAGMSMLVYGLLTLLACIYAGIVVGAWGNKLIRKTERAEITWQNAAGGVVLLTVIKFIPVIGWIAGFLAFLVTFGSIAEIAHKKFWKER